MTVTELRLTFKMETGYYPIPNEPGSIVKRDFDSYEEMNLTDYVKWLEDKIIKNEQK